MGGVPVWVRVDPDRLQDVAAVVEAGAQVILPSELFQGPYFCVTQEERWFATAHPWREHPCVAALALARWAPFFCTCQPSSVGTTYRSAMTESLGPDRGRLRIHAVAVD